MDKFHIAYNYLSTRNYTHFLLLALLAKGLVSDVGYSTVLLTVPILLFDAYRIYIKSREPIAIVHDKAIMDELDKLKAKVNANSMEKNLSAAPAKRYF